MLTYTTYVQQMANLMVISSAEYTTDYAFQTFLPGCIDYAEQRLYRELDLLNTRVTDTSASFTVNSRNFTLPTTQGTFLVIEEINTITPSTATVDTGTRKPIQFVSRPFIDNVYPSNTASTGVPVYAAMLSDAVISVGPIPDSAYPVEVIGTIRPTPLSSSNTSTILTTLLPDLFIAASMVFASGYMRDFGQQADNPAMGASWEGQYEKLITSAGTEELRKKYSSQSWQSMIPNPVAQRV